MKFFDEEIEKLNLQDTNDLEILIVNYFCGKTNTIKVNQDDECSKSELLNEFMKNVIKNGLNYEQFNELLLLFNQSRISKDFFNFVFEKEQIELADLKHGVTKFRGFAMLCFGNFRFAYKELIKKNQKEINNILKNHCKDHCIILENFKKRPQKMLKINKINRDDTWLIGETNERKILKEVEHINFLIKENKQKSEELIKLSQKYVELTELLFKTKKRGLKNTDIYLTWDYMDVYVATSMRYKYEFQQTYDFINKVFKNPRIKKLNLRFFDPTQSKCKNRIDKGLLEGLMLKRVYATIYMVQENDTIGKDSELAATLAQGKPVIAFVPRIEIEAFSKEIKQYPFYYFKETFNLLSSKDIFKTEYCVENLKKYVKNYKEILENTKEYIKSLDNPDNYSIFKDLILWQEEHSEEYKKSFKYFEELCLIIAIGKYHEFENRANLLKELHPLALQIDLDSGVANGVLVVRTPEDCVEVLFNLMTNKSEFVIKNLGEEDWKITGLYEKITNCPFRVITDNKKISNSFWNFYLNQL